MTTHRRQQIRPHAPTLSRGEDARPACGLDPSLVGALIDTPRDVYLARAAAETCGACELAATCLTDKTDKHWAKAARGILVAMVRAAA